MQKSASDFTIYPLAWIASAFAIGICLANFAAIDWRIALALLSVIILSGAVFLRHHSISYFILAAFIVSGSLFLYIERQVISPGRIKSLYDSKAYASGDPVEIEGIILGKPELAPGGFFLLIDSEKAIYHEKEEKVSGKIRLYAAVADGAIGGEYDELSLKYGSRVRIACFLNRDEKFQNPGSASFRDILDQKEIDASGFIKSPLLIEKLGESSVFLPKAWLYELRQDLILDFRNLFSPKTAGVLIASLLNNRYYLDKDTSERFREGGTFHALVISGMHITFIGGWLIFILQRFSKNRWWQFLLAGIFIWAFIFMVGAEAPVVRAGIMFSSFLFARVIFRDGNLINALGGSALLILIWRPSDLFDHSFQLTFTCVIAIVAMAFPILEKLRAIGEWRPKVETPFSPNCSPFLKKLCEFIYWRESDWRKESAKNIWFANIPKSPQSRWHESKRFRIILEFIFESLVVSICVQIWLLPFMVYYFHRLSLVSLFLNIWVGAAVSFLGLSALGAVLLAKISAILALPLIYITEIASYIVIHAGDPFTFLGFSSIRTPIYPGKPKIIYLLYFLPLMLISYFLIKWDPFRLGRLRGFSRAQKLIFASFILIFAMIIFHPFSAPIADGRLHIDFLDVGQGDSALIRFPDGKTLLVDGGGRASFKKLYTGPEGEEPEPFIPDTRNIGESVVSEFLWEKGYSRIDYVLATHADTDHIQGLSDIARNFKISGALFGRMPLNDPDYSDLQAILERRNIPASIISRNDILQFGDARIEILYPEDGDEISDNNHSITFRLIFGDRKFLFTGDIEKETEALLLSDPRFLEADVVKVAHHGSKTSSTPEFISATKAKFAVISVGKESPFGHPNEEVVLRWKASDAEILETGKKGTVSFSSDGEDLRVTTFIAD